MLLDLLGASKTLNIRIDDDYTDRLHYFITSNMLIVLSILVGFKQFNGKPIECVMPKRFDDSYEDVSLFVPKGGLLCLHTLGVTSHGSVIYMEWVCAESGMPRLSAKL